jgi:hypothetical protein
MTIIINGDTGISGVSGTASAPAFVGGDADSGVYFSANNRIDFSTAGTARATITSGGNLQFDSGYGSVATAYGCRAWVNFNGTGTVAIREDGNVSSITDGGTGSYTVNFTTAMPDANYATLFTPGGQETTSTGNFDMPRRSTTPTTSAVQVLYSNGNQDTLYGSVAIFR